MTKSCITERGTYKMRTQELRLLGLKKITHKTHLHKTSETRMSHICQVIFYGIWVQTMACDGGLSTDNKATVLDAPIQIECARNSDCPGTDICLLSKCRVACKADKDCSPGSRCLKTQTGVG